ncbi:acetyl-CoA synthetase-like protein [Xylariomycetidae sp. FL2044]|nr:acetyl-CoA synthetase-like protein [Xylariomycetidae sp. FL2044]
MPIPLSIAAPATVAGLAYLNVKTGFWYDWMLLRGGLPSTFINNYRERKDRANIFWKLEERATAKSHASKPYVLYEDRSWTYAQVYDMALRYGHFLKTTFGIQKNDVVALNMQNSDHYIILCFGLWSIGAKPAFINYNLTGHALTHCVRTAKSVLMLVDPGVEKNVNEDVRRALGELRIEVLTPGTIAQVHATEPVRYPDELRQGDLGRDMAVLIYTSGTTGLPKAAIVSWTKITVATVFVSRWLNVRPSDIFYTSMPLYHSSATIMGFCQCLEAGSTFAVGKKFSTKSFWKEVRHYHATIIQYVGETCRYLVAAPSEFDPVTGENLDKKHNVRVAFGNGLRPDVWEKFRDRFGIDAIAEFYAATEGNLATWNYSRNQFSSGAIGRSGALFSFLVDKRRLAIVERDPETDIPIRDPKTQLCRQVQKGEVGELLFRLADDLSKDFQGYYNNPEATNSKVIRDVLKKGDIYFRSGDLLSLDAEGRMYFHDRLGDTFRWKSENVATTEVSEAVGSHPRVQEANVYGVQLPHHDGRAGCVAIVLDRPPDEPLLRSLADHARASLPKYAVPIFLRISKKLGMATTGTNKQQKHELRVQGVDPAIVGDDELFWLKDGTYVRFGRKDWEMLNGGQVRL